MSKSIKIKKGFDIPLAGKAAMQTAEIAQPETFAIKPTDFHGMLRPKPMVAQGDNVKAGTPILFDGKNESVMYTAPVSGEIVEVKRGAKRKLLEIVILADKTMEYESFPTHTVSNLGDLSRERCQEAMLKSGVWPNIIQRPFGIIADHEATPKAIFISAFDSSPLAADYAYILKDEDKYFEAGVAILNKFTSKVHLGTNGNAEVSSLFSNVKGVQQNEFSGVHPAGNVGVQIHHIDPINKGDIVWTISPVGVVQIGKLFLEGKYDASRTIALTGSEVKNPQYYKTFTGACVGRFIADNLSNDHVRVISGNILTGEQLASKGHLGFFDNQITVIPEGDYHEFLGWITPTTKKLSVHRAFGLLSRFFPKKEYVLDTNFHGEERAFVQTGTFEKVMPMDILPMFLIKAIMAEDFEEMEALGIYEVIEEDMALCEFVDLSKHDIQAMLRQGLDLIQYS